ncbi:6-phosphogluconolactonase [Cyanobacterium stanieri LEGE 03274]|uniref:6-phosphogluconolactonase n=1 Tax=Cyanobacterium stanieri LEGE 03274 TaxID=1828756 RepID=A0ABR9V7K5_9CHRO|nr:6-phosphogluconolactonase [Cyanobacterium stanieri]MBE9223501.1 6-phosphogluconolactonase [Cyanobacterium stanieri LEGE 03274]
MSDIKVFPSKSALIASAQEFIIEKIQDTITQKGICTIALAGGSTPKPIYEAIALKQLPWDKMHIFWGDERYVAPNHPDSNQKMAKEAWLNKVDIPPENIHPMPTTGNNPQEDALKHEQEIRNFFQCPQGFPAFDIILLGMGDDGHTASLFPHTQALKNKENLITVGNKQDSLRLTFSSPLINSSQCVIFLVSGSNKQNALKEVFSKDSNPHEYPSKMIQPQGELIWFLDDDAQGELKINP